MQINDINDLTELLSTSKFINCNDKFEQVELLKSWLNPYNIWVKYESIFSSDDKKTKTLGRVILTTHKNNNINNKFTYQCNGVVLSTEKKDNWHIIAYPAPMFKSQYIKSNLETVLDKDDVEIFYINDGTTITLYYWKDKWVMSSTNGYDISNYKWMGDKTYMELFNEVSTQYTKFSLSNLDIEKSYTVGFRHPNFHPLLNDSSRMWAIQSTSVKDGAVVVDCSSNFGLPDQLPVNEILSNLTGAEKLQTMLSINKSALNNYLSTSKKENNQNKNLKSLLNFTEKSTYQEPLIHYGFIVKRLNNTEQPTCIILESHLLRKIRQLFYNIPKKYNNGSKMEINHTNRMKYCALRSFLDVSSKKLFISLFPQFGKEYILFTNTVNYIIDGIIKHYKGLERKLYRFSSSLKVNNNIDILSLTFIGHIDNHEKLNSSSKYMQSIIHDYVVDPSYTDLYFCTLFSSEK